MRLSNTCESAAGSYSARPRDRQLFSVKAQDANMTMTAFERQILNELKRVTGNRKLKERDMLEWRSGKIEPRDGEKVIELKTLGVVVAIPSPAQ